MALMPFDVAAILIVLAATFGYLNFRFLKLPSSVGLTIMGAVASLLILAMDRLVPSSRATDSLVGVITSIDFHQTLMNGMLSFLLFAGALHVDWSEMRRGRWPILVLSTIGVLTSTGLIGGGFLLLSRWLGDPVPLIWCLVFGALISPTDPVAVMGVLKRTNIAPTLQATVAGESLFNDGVGVVVFSILLAAATGSEAFSLPQALGLFIIEAGGGVVLGFATGWIAFSAMRSVDDYNVEVMISLAVVMGGYALANRVGVSGPVAMAVAGILIGNHGVAQAMSDTTRDYLIKFWSLIDEILNAVLFLLIGLEVITVSHDPRVLLLGALSVPLALMARTVSVMLPLLALRPVLHLGDKAPMTLIWGGLRGGISVALALSLPDTPSRSIALAATYGIVLFAVIVQGSTIERLLSGVEKTNAGADARNVS